LTKGKRVVILPQSKTMFEPILANTEEAKVARSRASQY